MVLVAALLVLAGCRGERVDGVEGSATSIEATATEDDGAAAESGGDGDPEDASSAPLPAGAVTVGRTDVTPEGNRVVLGSAALTAPPVTVSLPERPRWIVPLPSGGERWLVVLEDDRSVVVDGDGAVTDADADGLSSGPDEAGTVAPPEVYRSGAETIVRSAYADHHRFGGPLPDTRVVSDGRLTAALIDPTDRYDHGVLGDRIEAGGIEVIDETTGLRTRILVNPPAVIEGIAPLLADVDGDGTSEVLVTVSDAEQGARLRLYRADGSLIAESSAIGRGRRWRNQLAVAPIGPGGELEIIDVRTPHLGGTVEFFRVEGARLVRAAFSEPDYTSHTLGSRNLDLGLVVDGDGDGRLDVVVPRSDRRALAILTRTEAGLSAQEIALPDRLVTNIAAAPSSGGDRVAVAVGLEDGSLLLWPSAPS